MPSADHVDRSSCSPLRDWLFEEELAQRLPTDDIFVPLAIHLMVADLPASVEHERLGLTAVDPNTIAPAPGALLEVWDQEAIREVFGANGGVNRNFWKPRGIRVAITLIEQCLYSPASVRGDGEWRDSVFMPDDAQPNDEGERLFRRVSKTYGIDRGEPERSALDVFIWWSVSEASSGWGYGRSGKKPGGPSIWLDIACVLGPSRARSLHVEFPGSQERIERPYKDWKFMEDREGCRLAAHEVGHALGLKHVDDPKRLMHADWGGRVLTDEEIEWAKDQAREDYPAVNRH